jgi:hypothetical protein
MKRCTHKTWRDFTLPPEHMPVRVAPDVRDQTTGKIMLVLEIHAEPSPPPLKWRCSGCGAVDVWDAGWRYMGNVECPRCWVAEIEAVHCPACAAKHKEPVAVWPTNSERSQALREARIAAKIAMAEAKVARLRAELKEARK